MKLKPQFRSSTINNINEDERSVTLSFSSEEPYERWWGVEILDHSKGAMDTTRLERDAPLLFNHDPDVVIGVVEKTWIENGKGYAKVRFGNSQKAKEVYEDVKGGILKNVSVGYIVNEMKLVEEKDEKEVYKVTKWQPLEISIVSIPADTTVGIGRSFEEKDVIVKGEKMDKQTKQNETKPTEPKVDVKSVKDDAIKQERQRIAEINAIAEKFGKKALGQKAIEDGVDVASFKSMILEELGKSKPIESKAATSEDIGLTKKESEKFSLLRALRALANPHDRRAQEAAKFEFEVSAEAQKRSGVEAQGVLVPLDILARDLTVTGTNNSGSNVVETNLLVGSFIELLRNKSAILQLATHLNGLRGNIAIPRQTASTTVYEVGETETLTDSDITLDQITMSPKRLGATSGYSKQVLAQESMDIENLIKNDILTQIALKIDVNAINLILNETGVGLVSIGDNGGAPTWSHFVQLESEITMDNADIGKMRYIINAKTQGYCKTTEKVPNFPAYIIEKNQINGYGYSISNQLPSNLTKGTGTNLSAILFGDFSQLLVGYWGGVDIVVDPYSRKKDGMIEITADQFYDMAIRHPQALSVIKDAQV